MDRAVQGRDGEDFEGGESWGQVSACSMMELWALDTIYVDVVYVYGAMPVGNVNIIEMSDVGLSE